jgi:hypothetical protein
VKAIGHASPVLTFYILDIEHFGQYGYAKQRHAYQAQIHSPQYVPFYIHEAKY